MKWKFFENDHGATKHFDTEAEALAFVKQYGITFFDENGYFPINVDCTMEQDGDYYLRPIYDD